MTTDNVKNSFIDTSGAIAEEIQSKGESKMSDFLFTHEGESMPDETGDASAETNQCRKTISRIYNANSGLKFLFINKRTGEAKKIMHERRK